MLEIIIYSIISIGGGAVVGYYFTKYLLKKKNIYSIIDLTNSKDSLPFHRNRLSIKIQ